MIKWSWTNERCRFSLIFRFVLRQIRSFSLKRIGNTRIKIMERELNLKHHDPAEFCSIDQKEENICKVSEAVTHIFWMLLLRNPSSVSRPIHSELRFIKLEWNTFSPYPELPRTMTRVRYSVCFLFFFFRLPVVLLCTYICIFLYEYTLRKSERPG